MIFQTFYLCLVPGRKLKEHQQQNNMEVIKEGYLERNVSTDNYKKQYKKFYFVLKQDKKSSSTKTLEYFKDSNWVKKEAKGVCNLYSNYTVNVLLHQKKKFIFEIVSVDKTHEVMTSQESEGEDWVRLLTESQSNDIFNVILFQYPPAAREYVKDLKGTVKLKIDDRSVTLLGNKGPVLCWRFSQIRKYKIINGLVVLEVGSRSVTGAGEFSFDTTEPHRFYDVIDKAVKERIKQRGITPNVAKSPSTTATTRTSNVTRDLNDTAAMGTYTADHYNENNLKTEETYNHLNSISTHELNGQSKDDTYDQLFSSNRMISQRRSEPHIAAPFLDNTERLSSKMKLTSPVQASLSTPSLEDEYVEMTSQSVESNKKPTPPPLKTKPLAATRLKGSFDSETSTSETRPSGKFVKLPPRPSKRYPLDLANKISSSTNDIPTKQDVTYDAPQQHNSPSREKRYSAPTAADEYSHLFEEKPKQVSQEYNHLDHSLIKPPGSTSHEKIIKPPGSTSHEKIINPPDSKSHEKIISNNREKLSLDFKNELKTQITNNKQSPVKEKKKPLKPVRQAPVAPPLIKHKNTAIPHQATRTEQPVYDQPRHMGTLDYYEAGYHQVGDTILGEYHRVAMDSDGYVEVPETEESESLYQVPKE